MFVIASPRNEGVAIQLDGLLRRCAPRNDKIEIEVLQWMVRSTLGCRLQSMAEDVVAFATTHAADADSALYDWARQKAVDQGYAWGSGATNGPIG